MRNSTKRDIRYVLYAALLLFAVMWIMASVCNGPSNVPMVDQVIHVQVDNKMIYSEEK